MQLSRSELGRRIGYQQIKKYENGASRPAASRLIQISRALEISVEGLFERVAARSASPNSSCALLAKPHSLRLMQAFNKVLQYKTRVAILELLETLAAPSSRT